VLWSADLLILFSDIDGLYTKNPKEHPDAELVETVYDVREARRTVSIGGANSFGTGGIATKLDAAERAASYGIPMILAHGGRSRMVNALIAGTQKGTAFLARTGKKEGEP
jgi:glutamate 5-kinase